MTYASETPGVACFDNSTVRLDLDNEPQPDLVLLRLPGKGGQARISADDYIEGAPELVVEVVGSSRAYDLHQKKDAYRRNGFPNTWRGLPASSSWSGGNCARASIGRGWRGATDCSRAAFSPACGSTPGPCCVGI